MRKRGARRLLATAAGLAVVALLAAGCTTVPTAGPSASGATTPEPGDCWTTTFARTQRYADWEGAPAVSCATPHQTYTYAVTKLGRKFTYQSWLTAAHNIRSDVDKAAYGACRARQKALLPGVTTKEALLYPAYYLPSTRLWAAGARWVRCDIAEIAVGSAVATPKLTNLPTFARLVSTLESNPTTYALCEDDPASNGPDGDQTTYADCRGPADYTFIAPLTMAGADGAAYPGLSALTRIGETQCATLPVPAGHQVIAEPPAKLDWTKYDDRELDCWLDNN